MGTKLKMSNFAERRKESREKHGEELRAAFKVIDKDNSGWASINEMCAYMVENKKFNLNKRSMGDFQASMEHYMKNFNYDKTRETRRNLSSFGATCTRSLPKLIAMATVRLPLSSVSSYLTRKPTNLDSPRVTFSSESCTSSARPTRTAIKRSRSSNSSFSCPSWRRCC